MSSTGKKRPSARRRAARRWTILAILALVAVTGVAVYGVTILIKGPGAQAAAYSLQGTALQIRVEIRQQSIFSSTFDRTVRVNTRDRQRQADLRPDTGGFGRVNLYRQAERVMAVAWGSTISATISTGDIEVLPGPTLPESPVGYLGAFDMDENKKLRFYSATDCPYVAIATTDRPRSCRG